MRCTPTSIKCGSMACWSSNCSLKGVHKFVKAKDARTPLQNDCEETFDQQLKTAKGQAEYQDLVRLIAQVLDASGAGDDCSLRISATRNKDAYCVTLYQDGSASYASALTWSQLLERVTNLI